MHHFLAYVNMVHMIWYLLSCYWNLSTKVVHAFTLCN